MAELLDPPPLTRSLVRDLHALPLPPVSPNGQIQNPARAEILASLNKDKSENRDMSASQVSPPNNNNLLQSDDDYKSESTKLRQISWPFPMVEPTGVGAGLYNSGNTCFIASVLQCFTHSVPLLDSLRSYIHQFPCNCGNEKFCVVGQLKDHINIALRLSGSNINVDRFRYNLNHFSSDFEIDHQEDAHEFLQSLLDKLERCCLDVNIVNNVFGGRLMSSLHCCNCGFISNTYEPSLGWSLEIEDVVNLGSALESFTSVEKLEDQITCDNCKEKVSMEKQLKLDKLPLVATFHLKRFKNDGLTMEKIFKHVEFPLELDLFPYISSNQNPEVSTKYHLYAFVEHLGSSATFGHYTSYVRSAPETWHYFDDAKVTRISEDTALSQNAYILFYAREGTPWFSTIFEQLKPVFAAIPLTFSPKSVHDHTYKSVGNSNQPSNDLAGVSIPNVNYSDFQCHEPLEEVFQSAEFICDDDSSTMADAPESPQADISEQPFSETSPQREPELRPAGDRANIDEVYVPVLKVQNKDLSPKRKAGERATHDGAYRPKVKIQKQKSPSQCQGSFQIPRAHLQIKNRVETRVKKPQAFRSNDDAASAALSYLNKSQTHRSRKLAEALCGSQIKKKKISA